jgi:hypothetical protein
MRREDKNKAPLIDSISFALLVAQYCWQSFEQCEGMEEQNQDFLKGIAIFFRGSYNYFWDSLKINRERENASHS